MLSILQKVIYLKQTDLFSRLPGEELAKVADATTEVSYHAGETIIHESDVGDFLCCLIEGKAQVNIGGQQLSILEPVEVCGEMSFFDPGQKRVATIIAITDVLVLELSHRLFSGLLEDRPIIAQGIIAILARRLREAHQFIRQVETQQPRAQDDEDGRAQPDTQP